ncbi:ASCH domain-containing protein [Staphylococcus sp. 50Mo3-1]|nr:ASCH domain-containing protein [Staphylococcus sp. KG4-3]MDW8542945.1 ASCH domain-containing protein [Staphylococcus sp. KG4-1]MDW8562352.1 ASCH domain-containing protein [Staphylococcus sp. KG4-3]
MSLIEHSMRLNDEPFQLVKEGTKTIEVRLNDTKRQKIQSGDFITFTNLKSAEQITVEVIGAEVFTSFQALLNHYSNQVTGFSNDIQLSQKLASIYQIYSQTDELAYGALAIEIRLITK